MTENRGKGKKSAVALKLSTWRLGEVAGFALPRNPRMSDMVGIHFILPLARGTLYQSPAPRDGSPALPSLCRATVIHNLCKLRSDSFPHSLPMRP